MTFNDDANNSDYNNKVTNHHMEWLKIKNVLNVKLCSVNLLKESVFL